MEKAYEIIDVFCVYGDYGDRGGGALIGVFNNEKAANEAANGRGSLDCGGDGEVVKRKAIFVPPDDFFLLESNELIQFNKVLFQRTEHACNLEGSPYFVKEVDFRKNPEDDPKLLELIKAGEKVEAVKYYRTVTGFELKKSLDTIRSMMG